jgi:hypothetical protein
VGLRDWTIELDDGDQVAAVRSRLETGGVRTTDDGHGFATADPWNIGLRVTERSR